MSQVETQNCTLRLVAQGQPERCQQERCAFWEPGGAVAPGACLIERLGVDVRRPDLATYLLETRDQLEEARNVVEAERVHREFAARIGLEL